jgi:hypothetical protein
MGYGLSQSDHIKRLPLYTVWNKFIREINSTKIKWKLLECNATINGNYVQMGINKQAWLCANFGLLLNLSIILFYVLFYSCMLYSLLSFSILLCSIICYLFLFFNFVFFPIIFFSLVFFSLFLYSLFLAVLFFLFFSFYFFIFFLFFIFLFFVFPIPSNLFISVVHKHPIQLDCLLETAPWLGRSSPNILKRKNRV